MSTAGTYRMRNLCAQTGLSRQAIHFYIQEGLLPEGTKTGRNMAFYGPAHVERLRLVRRLQEERYLPLKQIRAMLDGDGATAVDVDRLAAVHGVDGAELERMIELGLVTVRRGDDGARLGAADATWLIDLWGQLRGRAAASGRAVTVDELVPVAAAVAALVRPTIAAAE